MRSIRSEGTEPERKVIRELRRRKIYFTKYVANIIGKPDIVFRRKKVAVFIDSDFWHGHSQRCIFPKTNPEYWKNKISTNIARDQKVNEELERSGWLVVRIWEYDIKHDFENCIQLILKAIGKCLPAT